MVATKSPSKTPSKKLKAGKKKSLNKWVVVAGVAAVAIIGVVVVRYSGASSNTFNHTCNSGKLYGGTKQDKTANGCVKTISSGGTVTTTVTASVLQYTSKVCVSFVNTQPNTSLAIQKMGDNGSTAYFNTGSKGDGHAFCTNKFTTPIHSTNTFSVKVYSGRVNISRIYGI